MNDFVIKLPLAMRFYLIGLIYRNSRMSCSCLAEIIQVAHDRLYRVLYLSFPYSRADVGLDHRKFSKVRRLSDN